MTDGTSLLNPSDIFNDTVAVTSHAMANPNSNKVIAEG
ncbi:hypothetical protein NS506_05732 [Nocardia seriolae]|uniref:Uncharacterized protein n=1 Tax=Nocardia seriolae TaxID=37332 RepID=A0ABC8AZW7_9NOCA|nr:hypothetical protein NS506_05732 [Nocardia seriolae]